MKKDTYMALDNSLYDALKDTYFQIKEYLDNTQLGREHSPILMKHEELAELLESFDVEALEEQSKDIHALHDQLDAIKEVTQQICEDLKGVDDSVALATKVAGGLDTVFSKIKNIVP